MPVASKKPAARMSPKAAPKSKKVARKTARTVPHKPAPSVTPAIVPETRAAAPAAVPTAAPTSKVTPEHRYRMIQKAAYLYAEKDGFKRDPAQYWLTAESDVDEKLAGNA